MRSHTKKSRSGMFIDINIVVDRALELVESGEDTTGVCLACGEFQSGCEPDARARECESCGASRGVFGAEEIIMTHGGF